METIKSISIIAKIKGRYHRQNILVSIDGTGMAKDNKGKVYHYSTSSDSWHIGKRR